MLPNVNAEKGNKASGGLQRILVGGGSDGEALVGLVVSEPAPAGALHTHRSGRQGALEAFQTAVLSLNGLAQLSVTEFTAAFADGGKVLPEDGVV